MTTPLDRIAACHDPKLPDTAMITIPEGNGDLRWLSEAVRAGALAQEAPGSHSQETRKTLEALSMWCTGERRKIRGRGGFDDQTEREIGIGLVESEIDRRAAALKV